MRQFDPVRMDEEQEPKENGNPMENMVSTARFDKKFIEERKIFLWGVVDDKSAKDITARLMYLDMIDPGKEIKFYIINEYKLCLFYILNTNIHLPSFI